MFTPTQEIIVKQVCSIQFKSLEDLIQKVNLGDTYEDLLKELEIDRAEWDMELIKTFHKFKKVEKNPKEFFTIFESLDILVFKYILFSWGHKWDPLYKKDFFNLWDKLFLWSCLTPN